MKLIVASTYRQACLVAERFGLHHTEWKHCPDEVSLRGYGGDVEAFQAEPVLLETGTIPWRRFHEALMELGRLERKGAKIRMVHT